MTWLAFIASVIGSLAWPIAIVILALGFRKQLTAILNRLIKAKGFGGEFEFAQALDKAETLTPPTGQPVPEAPRHPEGFVRREGDPPDYRVTYAWKLLVSALAKAARRRGLPIPEHYSPSDLMKIASQLGLPRSDIRQIDQLRELRNRATHEIENTITTTDALRYEDLVLGLLERLEALEKPRGEGA